MTHIFRVIVPVGDIDRAAAFYERLLAVDGERVSPGRHYFDCEGVVLACLDPVADGDGYQATPLTEPLYIAVDDIEAAYERARSAGATIPNGSDADIGPPGQIVERPWGEVSFYAADPFGNPLCFVRRSTAFTGSSAR